MNKSKVPQLTAAQIYQQNQASDDEPYASSEDEDYSDNGVDEGTSGYRKGIFFENLIA